MRFTRRVKRLERAAGVAECCALCGQAGGKGDGRAPALASTGRSATCPRCGAGVAATAGPQRTAPLPPLEELPFSLRWLLGLERGGAGGSP